MSNTTLQPAVGAQVERGVGRWHRLLWGVVFTGGMLRDLPMLLGGLWHDEAREFNGFYEGEPTRALLFCTRREARHWCNDTNRKWQATKDPIQQRWRVSPVRVRETVVIEAPNGPVEAGPTVLRWTSPRIGG